MSSDKLSEIVEREVEKAFGGDGYPGEMRAARAAAMAVARAVVEECAKIVETPLADGFGDHRIFRANRAKRIRALLPKEKP